SRQLSLNDHRLADQGELSGLGSFHAGPPSSSRSGRRESTDCKSSDRFQCGLLTGNHSPSGTYNGGSAATCGLLPSLIGVNVPSLGMAVANSSSRNSIAHRIAQ